MRRSATVKVKRPCILPVIIQHPPLLQCCMDLHAKQESHAARAIHTFCSSRRPQTRNHAQQA